MKQRRSTFLMSAAAAAVLPGRVKAASLTPVRLGTSSGDDVTPIIYGMQSGIFARHGLALQVQRMIGAAAAGMIGGTFDISKSVVSTLLDAHARDLPIKLVAAASVQNPKAPYVAFLLKQDAADGGADFDDKVVGLGQLRDLGELAMSMWIDAHGGNSKTVKFVDVPTTAAAAAVELGRVYASESTQPMIASALATGKVKMASMYDVLGTDTVLTAWATTVDFSTKNPDVIRAFARAYKEAATYTNGHHAETVEMMAAFSGVPASIVATMPRATAGPTLTAAHIQPLIDASVKYGMLARSFPASELIDPNIL